MPSQENKCSCKKAVALFGGIVCAIILLAFFTVNAYFYVNPLDEPGVGFQAYMPRAFPGGVKVADTTAQIVALARDPRHARKDWLGRDLDAARLEITMKDSTGAYTAAMTEYPGFDDSCTPASSDYHLSSQGIAYCRHTDNVAANATTLRLAFSPSIEVASSTIITVNITMPGNQSVSDQQWGAYVDSFQKHHFLNLPITVYHDPMQY